MRRHPSSSLPRSMNRHEFVQTYDFNAVRESARKLEYPEIEIFSENAWNQRARSVAALLVSNSSSATVLPRSHPSSAANQGAGSPTVRCEIVILFEFVCVAMPPSQKADGTVGRFCGARVLHGLTNCLAHRERPADRLAGTATSCLRAKIACFIKFPKGGRQI